MTSLVGGVVTPFAEGQTGLCPAPGPACAPAGGRLGPGARGAFKHHLAEHGFDQRQVVRHGLLYLQAQGAQQGTSSHSKQSARLAWLAGKQLPHLDTGTQDLTDSCCCCRCGCRAVAAVTTAAAAAHLCFVGGPHTAHIPQRHLLDLPAATPSSMIHTNI